jgi:hypothetical protein
MEQERFLSKKNVPVINENKRENKSSLKKTVPIVFDGSNVAIQ